MNAFSHSLEELLAASNERHRALSAAGSNVSSTGYGKNDVDAVRAPDGGLVPRVLNEDYLVDPASSHMLVSKIKPCMSKYMPKQGETANGSLNQLWFLRSFTPTWITVAILELIHAVSLKPSG